MLLANVIHGAKNKILLFSSVSSMLRLKGLITVLNWKVEDTPRGPPMKMRPTEEQTVCYLERAGYVDVSVVDVPPYHYAAIAHCANT